MKTTPLAIDNPFNRSNPFKKPTPKLFLNPTKHDQLSLELTSVSYRPISHYKQSWEYQRASDLLSFSQNPYLPSKSPYKITEFQKALKSSYNSFWGKNRSLESSVYSSSIKNENPFGRKYLLNNFVDSHLESSYHNEKEYYYPEYKYYKKQEPHNQFNETPVPQPFQQSQKSVDSNPPNFNQRISSQNNHKDDNNQNQELRNNKNQQTSNNQNQTTIQKAQEATDRPKAIYIRGKKYFWKPVSRAQ